MKENGPYEEHNEDARIEKDILARLHNDPKTDVSKMQVEVKDGHVSLKGVADTGEEKQHAGEIAGSVPGVKQVDNQLHIELGIAHALSSFVTRIVSGDDKSKDREEDKEEAK